MAGLVSVADLGRIEVILESIQIAMWCLTFVVTAVGVGVILIRADR